MKKPTDYLRNDGVHGGSKVINFFKYLGFYPDCGGSSDYAVQSKVEFVRRATVIITSIVVLTPYPR